MKAQLMTLIILMTAAGCHYDSINYGEIPGTTDYLPLKIGNYWNFKQTGISTYQAIIHREVVSVVNINNHQYYLLVDSTTNYGQVYKDSTYYRVDPNGFVYQYRKNQTGLEENCFRLNGKDHDTWTYPIDGNDVANITLTFGSVTLEHGEIANCKSYYYDVIQWADEEYTITLAPGIGFVKEYSNAWGLGQVLQSARIGGQVYQF